MKTDSGDSGEVSTVASCGVSGVLSLVVKVLVKVGLDCAVWSVL